MQTQPWWWVMKSKRLSPKPVLIEHETVEALKTIQEDYAKASPLGVAPSIQDIARGLIRQALEMNKVSV
jgi:hypothetical protein